MFRMTSPPPLSIVLDGLLTSDHAAIARQLDVSPATFRRWIATDNAPRAAVLALFYESRWGYSLLESTAYNGRMWAEARARSLERENRALRRRIERLEALGSADGFGAASAPHLEPVRRA